MINRHDITDEYSVKCDLILNTVIFIDATLNIFERNFENVMFNDFIYFAKGFRMRPKVRSTLRNIDVSLRYFYTIQIRFGIISIRLIRTISISNAGSNMFSPQ